ncbi:MAG TPA: hypothetical protein VFJ16_08860 [Longimicrobium sp.]|nr:hypothetical protein [Longimicrobium sp.]
MTTDVDALEEERIFAAGEALLRERNMFDLSDIGSFDEFDRNRREHLERLRQTGRPRVLTVDGEQEFVVQSAAAYRELLRRLDYAETVISIRDGLEAVDRGDTLPLDEAFEQIRNGTWRRDP